MFDYVKFKELVIVAGCPRSGTSWLGKILDSHPTTLYKFEPFHQEWFPEIKESIPYTMTKDQKNELAEEALKNHVNRLLKSATYWLNKPPYFKKSYRYFFVNNLLKYIIPSTRQRILEHPIFFQTMQFCLVIKTIRSNFRLGWMDQVLKNPKILYIIRHPCGYVNSIRSMKWSRRGFTCLKKAVQERKLNGFESLFENFEEYDYFQKEALRWRVSVETALMDGKEIPYFKVILYEDLSSRPYKTVKELFNFLKWEVTDSTWNFVEESTKIHEDKSFSVYKNSKYVISKWKYDLTKEEKEKISSIVADSWVVKKYGYEVSC